MSIDGVNSGATNYSPGNWIKNAIHITAPKPGDPNFSFPVSWSNSNSTSFDKNDYYVTMPGVKYNGPLGFGATTLERAIGQSYQLRINSDGTVNFKPTEVQLQELRENGAPKELNWNAIEKYHLHFMTTSNLHSDVSTNQIIDEFASSYVALKGIIDKNFSGDEHTTQMDQLNQVFGRQTDALAHSFASDVSGFLESAGGAASGEYGKLHESLKAAISEKVQEYTAFIAENKDYAQVEGTQDAWLADNYRYMSTRLQQAVADQSGAPQAGDAQTGAPTVSQTESAPVSKTAATEGSQAKSDAYSYDQLREIDRFARIGSQIANDLKHSIGYTASEEEFGFRLGLTMLQSDYLIGTVNAPEKYRSALANYVNKSVQEEINKIDELYNEYRDRGLLGAQESFPPLNQQAIRDVFDLMRSSFKRSKDLLTAINEGMMAGKSIFFRKQYDAEHYQMMRYGSCSSDFWDRYNNPTMGAGGIMHNSITSQIQNKFQDMFGIDLSRKLDTFV